MTRVALFAAGLAGAFLAALLVGRTLDVGARTVADEHAAAGDEHGATAAAGPGGLSLEQDGYRLVPDAAQVSAGTTAPYRFRILSPAGAVLRDFDVEHERRLHLIVAPRSPDGPFLHLHPVQQADGAWSTPLRLPAAGSYRVFADFTTGGERRTLGIDLEGRGGPAVAPDLPARYDVRMHGHGSELEFTVRDPNGRAVEVERYLGARGHLVVLREGDFAYLHAHADEDRLAFEVPFPTAGAYRAYLQFQVGGRVETARFEVNR